MKDGVGRFSDYTDALRCVANMDGIDWWQIVKIEDGEIFMMEEGKRA